MFTTILFIALFWFVPGYLAARITALDFEQQFGSGTGSVPLYLLTFILGPVGLAAAVLGSAIDKDVSLKTTFRIAVGLEDYSTKETRFWIDRPRPAVTAFFLAGVKNLPVHEATWDTWSKDRWGVKA